jgi:hypothetical protein
VSFTVAKWLAGPIVETDASLAVSARASGTAASTAFSFFAAERTAARGRTDLRFGLGFSACACTAGGASADASVSGATTVANSRAPSHAATATAATTMTATLQITAAWIRLDRGDSCAGAV